MITQHAIGCKLDTDVLEALRIEAAMSGHKVNRIINDALVMYLHWANSCRQIQRGTSPNMELNVYYTLYKDVCRKTNKLQL